MIFKIITNKKTLFISLPPSCAEAFQSEEVPSEQCWVYHLVSLAFQEDNAKRTNLYSCIAYKLKWLCVKAGLVGAWINPYSERVFIFFYFVQQGVTMA